MQHRYASYVDVLESWFVDLLMLKFSSTDDFQGQEKENVIFSAVWSNNYGAVGFVSDWRRVNVSYTRARRALIVICNDMTLG